MAGQIYVSGDCHGQFSKFNTTVFSEQKKMNPNDYVILCGDTALTWDSSKETKHWVKWLAKKSYTTLWVDGNHENFDILYSLPVEEWKGGKVHFLAPNVIHLMRGQVYDLAGVKIFTFGGAKSHDIDGGIFEMDDPNLKLKLRQCEKNHQFCRINHRNWWKEELPSKEEMEEGRKNLEAHNWEVDFIVTHCCASSTQAAISDGTYKQDILTDYFEEIKQKCKFKKWFFGHYHDNQNVSDKEILIYEQIIRIR